MQLGAHYNIRLRMVLPRFHLRIQIFETLTFPSVNLFQHFSTFFKLASVLRHETSASYAAQSVRCSSVHTTTSVSEWFFLDSIFVFKSSKHSLFPQSTFFNIFQPFSNSLPFSSIKDQLFMRRNPFDAARCTLQHPSQNGSSSIPSSYSNLRNTHFSLSQPFSTFFNLFQTRFGSPA